MTAEVGRGLRRFRRDALRTIAATLAVGTVVIAVVLAVAAPGATTLDLVFLVLGAVVHAVVAVTVGRRWEPAGPVNIAYVLLLVALSVVAISQSASPAFDTPWVLLVPILLASITLSRRWQVAVTLLAVGGFIGASAVGPGISVGYVAQRSTAFVLFAAGMGVLTRRLAQALAEADTARAALRADVESVTSRNVELQRLDTARDDYVSSVSHELRTPLTVILGMARTLDEQWDELDDDGRRRLAGRVAASAGGLEGIVSALLDLARIERGGFEPVLVTVALDPAVSSSMQRLGPLLAEHDVTSEVPELTRVVTDPRLLDRVLDNLLTNAVRHTPAGTAVTVVAVADGGSVRVEVRDTGPGIPPDDVARLGEQFFRSATAPDVEGLGLGLALVVEVLRTLDSELEVASTLGEGTTFAFSLPLAEDDADS